VARLAAQHECGAAVIRSGAEDGVAIAMAMMATLLISALAAALILLSSSETIIAAHFRSRVEARYAADAAMARGIDVIAGLDDWSAPIAGTTTSGLVDGSLAGLRTLADGAALDLVQATNLANCQNATGCSADDLTAVTVDRPWGSNNPRWQPYAYGPLSRVLADAAPLESAYYVILFVADDPAGTHNAAAIAEEVATREGIALRAEAFGPSGAHAIVEVIASRQIRTSEDETAYNPAVGPLPTRILSWREVH
jgi:hypothetical protein